MKTHRATRTFSNIIYPTHSRRWHVLMDVTYPLDNWKYTNNAKLRPPKCHSAPCPCISTAWQLSKRSKGMFPASHLHMVGWLVSSPPHPQILEKESPNLESIGTASGSICSMLSCGGLWIICRVTRKKPPTSSYLNYQLYTFIIG